jgi:hypothetical protein
MRQSRAGWFCASGPGAIMKAFFLSVVVFLPSAMVIAQDAATARENPNSSVPYETGNAAAVAYEERWSDFLPIFGKAARQQGYVLPRPFGLSLGYLGQKQPFSVGAIVVEGVDVKTSGLAVVNEVDNQEDTITLRFDAWLFPFLNVYGILGKTDGQAEGPLQLDPSVILGNACLLPGVDCSPINTSFDINYEGDVGGGGMTIAGGYKDFFGMVDSNYTVADLDISSTDAKAWVTSTRFGWNGRLGFFTGALWVGAMYQDIDQTLDLLIPAGTRQLEVSIEQGTRAPWNTVLGGRWEFAWGLELLAEFGFGQRRSNMLNLTWRF